VAEAWGQPESHLSPGWITQTRQKSALKISITPLQMILRRSNNFSAEKIESKILLIPLCKHNKWVSSLENVIVAPHKPWLLKNLTQPLYSSISVEFLEYVASNFLAEPPK
jgi:hypothetical protein